MDDERIENLLRKAPEAKVPEGLRERLLRGIRVPRVAETGARWSEPSWIRRWMPALSFGVFFLGCVVVIGMQSERVAELKRSNETLRATAQNLEQLRTENEEYQRLKNATQELERLRRDSSELERLRTEVAGLKAQVQEAQQLRADNQRLQKENEAKAAQVANQGAETLDQAMAKEMEKAERTKCINNMKQIGLSFRTWASDYDDTFPMDYISMTNELNNPILLQCPGDKAHNVKSWADVAAGNVSYEYLTPGIHFPDLNPETVAARCPIHHVYLCIDGSVQWLTPVQEQQSLKTVNGRLTFVTRTLR